LAERREAQGVEDEFCLYVEIETSVWR